MDAPFDLVSWNSLELTHALKLTNRLGVETVITEGLLPFKYSHKTLACNKYIANIKKKRDVWERGSYRPKFSHNNKTLYKLFVLSV